MTATPAAARRAQRASKDGNAQRRMGLARRCEGRLDADVKLVGVAEGEPGAAAGAQRFGLLDLGQPEQVAEEAPCLGLAARGRCDLDVVEAENGHGRTL